MKAWIASRFSGAPAVRTMPSERRSLWRRQPLQDQRQAGFRLVYSIEDKTITVTVIAVGKRDRNEVYDVALSRLLDPEEP